LTATDLQSKFGIDGALKFEDAPGGLTRAIISVPQADATVYLHGAHVASWTPRGQQPVLYLSSRSKFEAGAAIRGGVPLVFPWFGPRSDGKPGPMHGFARISEWSLESAHLRPDGALELLLTLTPDDSGRLRFRVSVGTKLEMELEVHNPSSEPLHFEEAFHSYFAVGDIHGVGITGLGGSAYVDKTDAFARKSAPERIAIAKETDQVHLNTRATCEIADVSWKRTIVVEKAGSDTTVVWNPWIDKNRTLADMAPGDWQNMLCIETANAMENAVVLPAGGVHRMAATISVR
jgi:glucose-6-phosphate 1-epimerase